MSYLQTGKTNFVEHRTFLHLYRSFHRLWIFLLLMFQVSGLRLWLIMNKYILNILSLKLIFHWLVMQGLSIIAFHHGKIDIDTFKILLSAGPAFFILNFIECMFSMLLLLLFLLELELELILASSYLFIFKYNLDRKLLIFLLFLLYSIFYCYCSSLGCLDVLLMFGAYKTARGFAISRLVIRFFWLTAVSTFVTYLYVWVFS